MTSTRHPQEKQEKQERALHYPGTAPWKFLEARWALPATPGELFHSMLGKLNYSQLVSLSESISPPVSGNPIPSQQLGRGLNKSGMLSVTDEGLLCHWLHTLHVDAPFLSIKEKNKPWRTRRENPFVAQLTRDGSPGPPSEAGVVENETRELRSRRPLCLQLHRPGLPEEPWEVLHPDESVLFRVEERLLLPSSQRVSPVPTLSAQLHNDHLLTDWNVCGSATPLKLRSDASVSIRRSTSLLHPFQRESRLPSGSWYTLLPGLLHQVQAPSSLGHCYTDVLIYVPPAEV